MKQIERYILRRMSMLTFWSLASVTILVMTTQVLIRVDVLTTTGQAIGAFLLLAATLIPSVLSIVAPFALLIGVSQVLSGMNADSELVVVEAAGARPVTVLKPVLALAAAMSIMVLLVANFVEPWSNRKALRRAYPRRNPTCFRWRCARARSCSLKPGLFVQVNEKLPGGELSGIFLADSRTEDSETIYYARSGVIRSTGDKNILYLVDGELQQRSLSNDQISIVTFTSYALGHGGLRARGTGCGAATQGAAHRLSAQSVAGRLLHPEGAAYHQDRAGAALLDMDVSAGLRPGGLRVPRQGPLQSARAVPEWRTGGGDHAGLTRVRLLQQ